MLDHVVPNLTITGLPQGPTAETKDLRCFLYRNSMEYGNRKLAAELSAGRLGAPLLERLPLLVALHQRWQRGLEDRTIAPGSFAFEWSQLRLLIRFSDAAKLAFSKENGLRFYLRWAESLKTNAALKDKTKYSYSCGGARLLADAIGQDATKMQWRTKIRKPPGSTANHSKENLEQTRDFIQIALETIVQLTPNVIRGPLPVVLQYADGKRHEIHCGKVLKPIDSLLTSSISYHRRFAEESRERLLKDTSNTKRAPLINLRLELEMLVFINQTGGNLTQALRLTGSKFSYQSDGDYLRLFVWKNRAKHSIPLRIHKGYRHHFEQYLKFRATHFPDDIDGLTFPFVGTESELTMQRSECSFRNARKLFKSIESPFVTAGQLRKTIANFVKRHSSRQLAAEILGNTQTTFAQSYEEVHHQTAVSELTTFWDDVESFMSAVGPGGCLEAAPERIDDAPPGAPEPDCQGSGGCLFCTKNRDLDSFDHVWNLASLHHLKMAEFNSDRTPESFTASHPGLVQAERAVRKLAAFSELGGERANWVVEANLRVEEGRYHPYYAAKFEILDGHP